MRKIFNKYFILELFTIILLLSSTLLIYRSIYFMAFLLIIVYFISKLVIRNKMLLDVVNMKSISIVMIIFGVLYVALYYMLGLYTRFYNNEYILSINSIIQFIIPISIIIIFTELIRNKLLISDSLINKTLLLFITIIPDFVIYSKMYAVLDLDRFLVIIGYILFASISNNLLFNYLSSKYGAKPIIIYRLITTLYAYTLPVIPNVYMFFRTFVRIFYPLLIYYYVDKYFDTDKKVVKVKDRRLEVVSMSLCTIIMIFLIALVSCRFDYGALVIGSTSMAGTLDKGDVIVYENPNKIKLNDIIVFKKDNVRIVHRIVKIDENGIDRRYYTKGDANDIKDKEFITDKEIIGKVILNVKQIGRPTLWLREIFNKEG